MGLFDRWRKGKTAGSPAPAPKTPPEPQTLSAPEASSPELREAYPFLTVPCLALPRDLTPEALLRCWRKAGAEGIAPVLLRMDDMLCELLEDARWQGGDADIDAYLAPAIGELWCSEEAGIHLGTPADRAEPQHRLLSFDRFGSDPGDPVLLAFVPAEEPWQVFRICPSAAGTPAPDRSSSRPSAGSSGSASARSRQPSAATRWSWYRPAAHGRTSASPWPCGCTPSARTL